ncbi:MAG: hypothetical protein EGR93_06745 [Prevotella sp.]|nr:hypothetical protein [Prevotella sp.]
MGAKLLLFDRIRKEMVSFCINFNLYITNYNTFHSIYFQSDIFLLLLYYKLQERRKKKKEMRMK